MDIYFRDINPFDLWIWIEFENVPTPSEKQYLEELFDSWFYLGKLGGFNAGNLQVQDAGVDLSYMDYDQDYADHSMMSVMHNMSDVDYLGTWARCWFDLGTSDPIALDILINAFKQLSHDYLQLKQVIIGGENEDWRTDDTSPHTFVN